MTKVYSLFNESGAMQELKPQGLQINQIFFLNGYGQSPESHDRRAIYKIEGDNYHWVNLDKAARGTTDTYSVQPVSKLFGIGCYFHPDQFATAEEVAAAVRAAEIKEGKDEEAKEAASTAAQEVQDRGKALLDKYMPEGCKYVLMAELIKDTSNLMEDYHGSTTTRTIVLAFSKHGRDLFPEMRKAAANATETTHLTTAPTVDESGNERTEENKSWWSPKDEHREKYSMGAGFYLKDGWRDHDGWQVSKRSLTIDSSELQYAAGSEGGFMVPVDKQPKPPTKPNKPAEATNRGTEVAERQARDAEGVEVIQYSEKALALKGNTYPIKEQIKALGGKFNRFLKDENGGKFAGWIVSRTKADEIAKLIA